MIRNQLHHDTQNELIFISGVGEVGGWRRWNLSLTSVLFVSIDGAEREEEKKRKANRNRKKSDGAGALMRELNEISVMYSIVNLIEPEARETESGWEAE